MVQSGVDNISMCNHFCLFLFPEEPALDPSIQQRTKAVSSSESLDKESRSMEENCFIKSYPYLNGENYVE